jgi:hypothetical protein
MLCLTETKGQLRIEHGARPSPEELPAERGLPLPSSHSGWMPRALEHPWDGSGDQGREARLNGFDPVVPNQDWVPCAVHSSSISGHVGQPAEKSAVRVLRLDCRQALVWRDDEVRLPSPRSVADRD